MGTILAEPGHPEVAHGRPGYSTLPIWRTAVTATPAATPVVTTMLTAVDLDTRTLAATAYGEGSSKDGFDAMAAIANVLVRPQKARSHASASAFIKADKAFAFAAHDGNERYASADGGHG